MPTATDDQSAAEVKGWPGIFLSPFRLTGQIVVGWVNDLGAVFIFLALAAFKAFRPRQISKVIYQIFYIGARSTTIIMLVGLFTGMVLGLQSYYALVKFGAQGALGTLVSLSLIRELGPVLTAIMITARAGSAMTAQIGIQRISDQISALDTMRVDSIRYLISPRITASIISFPILTAVFDMIGIVGGYISGVLLLGANSATYIQRVQSSVDFQDIRDGFIKSLVFSVLVTTICSFEGYFAHMRSDSHGAEAVGLSTTSAVVISCVMVLISDYVVTSLLI
jgi:phospholipid/cholesterol/gamma-HCH transport system permease protein